MKTPVLDERTRISIELAMADDSQDAEFHQRQEIKARALGMSGAEIDAARRGWSFDARTCIAMSLAVVAGKDPQRHREQVGRALRAGLSAQACHDIEALAARFSH